MPWRSPGSLRGDGRPLFAANAALETPVLPHLQLWHACMLLREHRFDGHVAALTVHGLDGLESLVTAIAAGSGNDATTMRRFRGWTEAEWEQGVDGLRSRGILDAGGALTDRGQGLRTAVEETTDRLAGEVWEAMDDASRELLFARLRPLAGLLESSDGIRYPNPIGVPRPA